MPCRPSTSDSSTRLGAEASARAIADATVVLPVPPLPVTMCNRAAAQAEVGSPVVTSPTLASPFEVIPTPTALPRSPRIGGGGEGSGGEGGDGGQDRREGRVVGV